MITINISRPYALLIAVFLVIGAFNTSTRIWDRLVNGVQTIETQVAVR